MISETTLGEAGHIIHVFAMTADDERFLGMAGVDGDLVLGRLVTAVSPKSIAILLDRQSSLRDELIAPALISLRERCADKAGEMAADVVRQMVFSLFEGLQIPTEAANFHERARDRARNIILNIPLKED